MSGKNGIQSSSSNPNQNKQQPQQQSSAFGQPKSNAFGVGAFGSTGAFGQPQQPQSANPMFGNLGAPSTSTSAGLFGQSTKPEMATSTFGAPKPETGFGAFGGCITAFGKDTSVFGSTTVTSATGNGLFGSTTNTGGTFGNGGNFDGRNKPATTAFGGKPVTDQDDDDTDDDDDTVAPVTTGTTLPPYSVYTEKNGPGIADLKYHIISAMPAYRGTSLEELRVQDYERGRKPAGAFGKPFFSFGTPATQLTSTFGAAATRQPTASSIPKFGQGREYFKPPLEKSTRIFRHDGTLASALDIIRHLLDNGSTSTNIQRGIADEHEKFVYTAAGEGLTSALREQAQSHDEKLRSLRAEMEAEMKARDEKTRREMQEELEKKREELAHIKRDVECMTERFVSEKTQLESRIAEMEAANRQHVERLQGMQSQVSQALLQVMKCQTETARQKEEEERQARILAEERLANVLAGMKHHKEFQADQAEMNKRLYALQDEMSRILLEKKADGQHQTDPKATKTYTNGQAKNRETSQKEKGRVKKDEE